MNQFQKILDNYSITRFSSKMLVATVLMLYSTMTLCGSFTLSSLHGHFERVVFFFFGGLSSTSVPAAAVPGPLPQARRAVVACGPRAVPAQRHDVRGLQGLATAARSAALGDPVCGLACSAGRRGAT